ncbi:MAG: hypothetical protein CV087_17130 [Candidatus Brocadia sp. WS118]|nr:MAG: hypothetical protein CV087_17130 [Candidatus Brocadia sp. WS118]
MSSRFWFYKPYVPPNFFFLDGKFAQVTLPADLRKKFNLAEGDLLEAKSVENGILLNQFIAGIEQ